MKELLIENFKRAKNKLILLDYDGTLVDYKTAPQDATPSKKLLFSLLKLNESPRTKLVIITGRAYQDIDGFVGHLPIDILAEHGAMIRENDEWKELVPDDERWKQTVYPVLNRFIDDCPGSFVEEKRFAMAWHYRNADQETGFSVSRQLIDALAGEIRRLNLKITDGNKVVEIKRKDIDKGRGTVFLLDKDDYDYILAIGDDKTDEDMFVVLADNPHAFTIKVGEGATSAKYRLENVQKVMGLLNELL
jgi:trehalose 6-phosphate synthase/phosphatase